MIDLFNHVDHALAKRIAKGIGLPAPEQEVIPNHGKTSPSLSMENTIKE